MAVNMYTQAVGLVLDGSFKKRKLLFLCACVHLLEWDTNTALKL